MSGGESHMRTERIDEVLLVRYLLGNLTEEEQARVEDRAFADRDYLGTLNAVEADLIDAYVRRELAQADRRAFERRFPTSPQRRSKIEFAQALSRVAAEVTTPATTWRAWLDPIRSWNPALRFAGALGAAICVAGGSWLVIENASMRSRVSMLEAQRRDLEMRAQRLQRDLTAQSQNPPSVEGPRTPLVASLVLMPGLSRAASRTEQLVLDRGVQIAHIEIQLEPRDEHPRFRADLRTRSGKEILVLGDLLPRRTGDGYTVSMDVPVSVLATEEYELGLKSLRDGKDAQDVGYYYFGVEKR
jgi:hypothetical protein